MDDNPSLAEAIKGFVVKNVLFIILLVAGIFLAGIGIFQYLGQKNNNDQVEFVSSQKEVKGVQNPARKISVDVEGKVEKPGVYQLSEDSRLQDGLVAAGGMSSNADRGYIGRHMNLAQKLTDGSKIYIPGIGEATDTTVISAGAQSGSNSTDVVTDNSGLININAATSEQLDTLPKVGPATAQKIISARPYVAIEELVSKKVLTQKTFDGLKGKITAE